MSSAFGQTWRPARLNVPPPPQEFRAAWIATVHNLTWPSSPGLSAEAQRAQLVKLLDQAASLHLNAVILQVRPAGDALYASKLEPWSAVLTGRQGVSPGYDPLAFAIQEAHRRGLELHAWFNPFRASAGKGAAAANHVSRRHPEWMRPFAGQVWMDPGEPGARAHTLAVMRDVLQRYDVDGIHIDDYFYPYPVRDAAGNKKNIPFPDEATWRRYGRNQSRDDWRRENINRFVHDFYQMAKSTRPLARVGVSPFGIWRPGAPPGIEARMDSVADIYADSRLWLQRGWCDYFSPQLYWRIQPRAQSFSALLDWWRAQSSHRPVWPGIAADRVNSSEDPGRPASEIVAQVNLSRRGGSPGAVLWSMKSLSANRGGVGSQLLRGPYAQRALTPPFPWLGRGAPGEPGEARAESTPKGVRVWWRNTRDGGIRWWAVQARRGGVWSLEAVVLSSENSVILPPGADAVAVRAVSGAGIVGNAVALVP